MNDQETAAKPRTAPIFCSTATPVHANPIPSSSPAFGTPVHPIRYEKAAIALTTTKPTVLPVLLPPATLRPVAFRTFTKKHNLTLMSPALQNLAAFIGKFCGSGWREEGLADGVLEEVAKRWKISGGGLIVEGEGKEFRGILKDLEGCMEGGKISRPSSLSRTNSYTLRGSPDAVFDARPSLLSRDNSQTNIGLSSLGVDNMEGEPAKDPRQWLKVICAFEQPRIAYSPGKKHFEKIATPSSLLPDPSHKTDFFRNRYSLVHQRLLRNESFQAPAIVSSRARSLHRSSSTLTQQQAYKLTPIANLLGRDGSSHVLLGLLTISPTGTLAISDLSGSIALDLSNARPIPEGGAWFTPGMIVIVDGIYEEEGTTAGSGLGGGGGVGGTIGGRFIGLSVGGPPCERREITLGVSGLNGDGDMSAGGGFGWVDFLGVGSERSSGQRMRNLEESVLGRHAAFPGRSKMVVIGEVNLDSPKTLQALKRILGLYAVDTSNGTPMTFILVGNFVTHAVMAGGGSGGSIEYKEYFDSLASTLSDFPAILQAATFVFVPGDNDPWASAFSAGAAAVIPRKAVPELFTSRVKRVFSSANAESERSPGSDMNGEAVWTTNPARLSLLGPAQETVIFRDDITGRLRRSAIRFKDSKTVATDLLLPAEQGSSGVERMDVDEAVVSAESHTPGLDSKEASTSGPSEDIATARKLVKTVLDQGFLSPFPLSSRPVLWDHASSIQLYPLPTALILVDPKAPAFSITYEGCHVMNPGRVIVEGKKRSARWIEFDAGTRRGKIRETSY